MGAVAEQQDNLSQAPVAERMGRDCCGVKLLRPAQRAGGAKCSGMPLATSGGGRGGGSGRPTHPQGPTEGSGGGRGSRLLGDSAPVLQNTGGTKSLCWMYSVRADVMRGHPHIPALPSSQSPSSVPPPFPLPPPPHSTPPPQEHRKALGDSDAATLTSLCNLALLRKAQGRGQQAEELLRQVLAGRRAALGEAHPDTAASCDQLAWVLQEGGKMEEAAELYQQVGWGPTVCQRSSKGGSVALYQQMGLGAGLHQQVARRPGLY